jgi:hypothetical protein
LGTLLLQELSAAEKVEQKKEDYGETCNTSYDTAHDFGCIGILVRS